MFKPGKRTQKYSLPAGLVILVAAIAGMLGFDLPTGWEDHFTKLMVSVLFFVQFFLGQKVDRNK